ncbi:25971_t:CDS:2, partial [Gigaspora rosea]
MSGDQQPQSIHNILQERKTKWYEDLQKQAKDWYQKDGAENKTYSIQTYTYKT